MQLNSNASDYIQTSRNYKLTIDQNNVDSTSHLRSRFNILIIHHYLMFYDPTLNNTELAYTTNVPMVAMLM